jgi:hypothetical protein
MSEGFIPVQGLSPEHNLETRVFTNLNGDVVHREGVFKGSPTIYGAVQEVDLTPQAARVVIYDALGNIITDSTANAARNMLVNAAGTAIGSASVHGEEALLVSDQHHPDDDFFGFAEHDISGSVNNVDMWGGPTDIQPEPVPAGFPLWVVSDSIEDDIDKGGGTPGTGAWTHMTHYLNTAGVVSNVTVNMNGTTPVDTGVTDCMFVNQSHHPSVGTNLVGVGNVDCTNGSGGAVVSRVGASGNQSMSTMKQVPAGQRLIVNGWKCTGTASTTKISLCRIRSTSHHDGNNPGVYHFIDSDRVKDFSTPWIPLRRIINSLATIKISAWTTGTISVNGRWSGYLEPNP